MLAKDMLSSGTIYFPTPNKPAKKPSKKDKSFTQDQVLSPPAHQNLRKHLEGLDREISQHPEDEGSKKQEDLVVEVKKESPKQKLDKLVEKTEQPLYKFSEAMPFLIKTKEVIIDISQVTIVHKQILGAKQIHSIPIEDIADVTVEAIPLFATLKIYEGEFTSNNYTAVKYLRKDVAIKARRLIQGLMIAKKNKINLLNVPLEDLKEKLMILGQKNESVS